MQLRETVNNIRGNEHFVKNGPERWEWLDGIDFVSSISG
jgi:hypothetical protein